MFGTVFCSEAPVYKDHGRRQCVRQFREQLVLRDNVDQADKKSLDGDLDAALDDAGRDGIAIKASVRN